VEHNSGGCVTKEETRTVKKGSMVFEGEEQRHEDLDLVNQKEKFARKKIVGGETASTSKKSQTGQKKKREHGETNKNKPKRSWQEAPQR